MNYLEFKKKAMLNRIKTGGGEIEFTTCPFPTDWTEVVLGTEYTATNTFGAWNVLASGYDGSHCVCNAFDNDTDTYWRSNYLSTSTTVATIEISCPKLIKPTQAYLRHRYIGKGTKLQGYNPDTSSWEDLYSLNSSSRISSQTVSITTNNYYSKFRISIVRYSNIQPNTNVYELQITQGFMKA